MEFNTGFNGSVDYSAFLVGVNLFSTYQNYELYIGYNQTSFDFGPYSVNGWLLGAKYHFNREEKINHFVVDFNFQSHIYWESTGTPPINARYNYDSYSYYNLIPGKTFSKSYFFSLGYEFVMNKHFMFYPNIGSGLVNLHTFPTDYGIQMGRSINNRWYISPYLQIAFRYYIFKNNPIASDKN